MIGYRTYNALLAHKGEIIAKLTYEYMTEYRLPRECALKNAIDEFNIKADVLQTKLPNPKDFKPKITVEKQTKKNIKFGRKDGVMHNWKKVVDPFTGKMYLNCSSLLKAYDIQPYRYTAFLHNLRKHNSVKYAMLMMPEILKCYPNEKRPEPRHFTKYQIEDHKGRKFNGVNELCKFYGVSRSRFYRFYVGYGFDSKYLTQSIEDKTFFDLNKLKQGYNNEFKF